MGEKTPSTGWRAEDDVVSSGPMKAQDWPHTVGRYKRKYKVGPKKILSCDYDI